MEYDPEADPPVILVNRDFGEVAKLLAAARAIGPEAELTVSSLILVDVLLAWQGIGREKDPKNIQAYELQGATFALGYARSYLLDPNSSLTRRVLQKVRGEVGEPAASPQPELTA